MALSKLAVGLIAGIGSVAAVGGITAGVVVSRNNMVVEATNDANESNSKESDKANISSTNANSLMADESKTTSTDTSSAMETKGPNNERGDETKPGVIKEPAEPMGGVQESSVASGTGSAAVQSTPTTTTTTTGTGIQDGENERGKAEAQQVPAVSTGDGQEERHMATPEDHSTGQPDSATVGTAAEEDPSSGKEGPAEDIQSQGNLQQGS